MTNKDIKFPQMLRYYRQQKGMKMKQLAKEMGKTESAISRWESGDNSPKMGEIQKIADVLGVTKSQLLGIEDSSKDEYIYEELRRIWFEFIFRKGVKENVEVAQKAVETIASVCQDNRIEFDKELFDKSYEINKILNPISDFNSLRHSSVMKLIDDDQE